MDGESFQGGPFFNILPSISVPIGATATKVERVDAAAAASELPDLLAQIAQRRQAALGTLYDRTVSRVYGLALRITRQREAAEEVTEEVYLQVWNQAERFDPTRGKALTWLLTMCHSRALDYLRRKEPADPHPEPESLVPELAQEHSDPQDILLAMERNTRIYEALQELPALQRQLLTLAFFKGLSHQEMADHTGMPLGTVKTHVRKALERMRSQLIEREVSLG
jgi:RNA polymerase sigma factor (sigma-70 family)